MKKKKKKNTETARKKFIFRNSNRLPTALRYEKKIPMEVEKLYTHIYLDSLGNITNKNLSPVTKKERSSQAPNAPGRWLLFLAFRGGERSRGNILFIYLNFLKSQHKYSDPSRLRLSPGPAPCSRRPPQHNNLRTRLAGRGGQGSDLVRGIFLPPPKLVLRYRREMGPHPELPLPRAPEASEQRGALGATRPGRRPHISPLSAQAPGDGSGGAAEWGARSGTCPLLCLQALAPLPEL